MFSNFGHTPFLLDGVRYASVEGLWQMMKYPDPKITSENDLRHKFEYPFKRGEVSKLFGFEAKRAGDAAGKINKAHNINYVSYLGEKFNYKDMQQGSKYHYKIIKKAIQAKVMQNPKVKELLLQTRGLVLKPDHDQGQNRPAAYFYHKILMDIRDKL